MLVVVGRAQAVTDANSHNRTTVFDSVGRTFAQVNALGYRTTLGYDQRGSRVAVTNVRSCTSTALFDAVARTLPLFRWASTPPWRWTPAVWSAKRRMAKARYDFVKFREVTPGGDAELRRPPPAD
jgi:YD repeat-containing protein